MPSAKPALQREPRTDAQSEFARRERNVVAPYDPRRITKTEGSPIRAVPSPITAQPRKETSFQPRVPVITGEAHYRGFLPIDGIVSGQLGATGSALSIKQRPRSSSEFKPELNGELSFKDMLRINGQVGGRVFSYKGTLIVDQSARVEAEIDVAVCVINGRVKGNVVAHDRVELGPGAIIQGNISTRSIKIKPGAIFQGECSMIKEETIS